MSKLKATRRQVLGVSLGGAAALGLPAWAGAADVARADIDAIVWRFMRAYKTPGIAVAIVRPGQPAFARGYGIRTLARADRVDAHTRFGIASHSKAFTAAALALLVDGGKLAWDDAVVRHLPEFRMYDPAVTQMMTVRDLLVHRSGLPLGAGDLMFFPRSSHVAADVLKALPYLKSVRGFRTGYDYDNILYLVAGVLIERLSGMGWNRFIAERILAPLQMTDTAPSRGEVRSDNIAGRHARLGPPVRGMGKLEMVQPDEGSEVDAAGGINASAADMAKWLQVQLDKGKLPNGQQLWSAEQAKQMWTPATITDSSNGPSPDDPTRPILQTYALGWFVQDYRGLQMIQHSGGLTGQVTYTGLLPSHGIGVSVFSNVEDSVSAAIRNAILDYLISAPPFDWIANYGAKTTKMEQEALASIAGGIDNAPAGGPSLPLAAYSGRYRDPWYGDVVVVETRGKLSINFEPTHAFKSALEPWGSDTFRTRFAKDAGEDAIVCFTVSNGAVKSISMKPLSPLADFSFDFQHLAFVRVNSGD